VNVRIKEHGLDVDIQREYNRQREYLERSVASLKTKLSKESERHKQENTRIMQENVELIRYNIIRHEVVLIHTSEINDLRREVKSMKQAQRQKELFGIGKGNGQGLPDTAWPPEAIREIEMQREEISRLRARIEELESTLTLILCIFVTHIFTANPSLLKRPISRERLPPLDGVHDRAEDDDDAGPV